MFIKRVCLFTTCARRILTSILAKDKYRIYIYPGSGTVDGSNGDHVIIAPPYNITEADLRLVAELTSMAVKDFFTELEAEVVAFRGRCCTIA